MLNKKVMKHTILMLVCMFAMVWHSRIWSYTHAVNYKILFTMTSQYVKPTNSL